MPKLPSDVIFLISGGLDSFIQWRLLGQPRAIYFAIGHKAEERELAAISKIRQLFNGDILENHSLRIGEFEFDNGYIPYRNLLFIMIASLHSQNVIIAQVSEWAPDKNRGFYRHTEKLLREIGTGKFQGINLKPRIYAPFSGYTKTELIRMYLRRWSGRDLAKYTVSCYSNMPVGCGKCNACFSRYVAMKNNGIEEPYATIPSYDDFKKRFDWHDFRFSNIPMYIKRWRELNDFRGTRNSTM